MAGKRKLKWKRWLVILLLIGGLTYLYFPMKPVKIIISKETTFIDGPVNPDGTINYVEALNEQFAKGATPENNAAPLLLKAFGVTLLPDETRDEILRRLELTAADIDRDHHFIPWDEREKIGKPGESQAAADSRAKLKTSDDDKDAHLGAFEQILRASRDKPKPSDGDRNKKVELEDVRRMLRKGLVHPELQGWLAANAEALRLVEKATTRPRHYMPSVSKSNPPQVIDVSLSGMDCCRDAAKTLVTRAMLKLHNGDVDGAWQDILTTHRLARLVQQGPFLIRQLVAVGIERTAAKGGGITLATSGQLTPQKARSMLKNLAALQPVGNVVDSLDRFERFMALDAIMMLSRGQGGGDADLESCAANSAFDWNEMLREVNRWRDRIVKPLRLPRFQGRAEANAVLATDLQEWESKLDNKGFATKMYLLGLGGRLGQKARTQAATNLLLTIFLPSASRAVDMQDAARMNFEIEKFAIALAGFHGEKGCWPAGLEELVPKYLPAVPTDCFSRNPLIYQPTKQGYLLYSVGKNQRDDSGVDNRKRSGNEDDIVAEVKK